MGKSFGDASKDPPITGGVARLTLLQDGSTFWLHELIKVPAPVHVLRVGSGEHNDIVVKGKHVTETHCLLRVTRKGVEVSDFGHPGETLVNKVGVLEGRVQLNRRGVLKLGAKGDVMLMAGGVDASDRPEMVVTCLYELIQEAPNYHGSKNQAAKALGAQPQTYARWIRTHKFKLAAPLALLLAVVGGAGGAMMLGSGDEAPTPTRPPSSAAGAVTMPAPAETETPTAKPPPVPATDTAAANDVAPRAPEQSLPLIASQPSPEQRPRAKKRRERTQNTEAIADGQATTGDNHDAHAEAAPTPKANKSPPEPASPSIGIKRAFTGKSYRVEDGQLVPIEPASREEGR